MWVNERDKITTIEKLELQRLEAENDVWMLLCLDFSRKTHNLRLSNWTGLTTTL